MTAIALTALGICIAFAVGPLLAGWLARKAFERARR